VSGSSPPEPDWRRAYALVLGALAVEVVLFWMLGVFYGGAS
jgi:hypothetical protein